MENATEALKLGASILIFVLALMISINAFTEARQTSQIVLEYNDREYDLKYEDRYIEDNGTTERVVSAEAIVTAIYKSYTENYKIVIEDPDIERLYRKSNNGSYSFEPINYIDLRKESLASVNQKRQFLQGILYGENSFGIDKDNIRKEYKNLGIQFTTDGIYNKIKGKKYTEKLGVYYEQDTYDNVNTPTANFDKKRIITYERKY